VALTDPTSATAQELLVNVMHLMNPLSVIVLGVLGALGALVVEAERRHRATQVPVRVGPARNRDRH
jgi:heme/copper-type cytochrome/quinol oxidase subunit 2